VILRKAAVITPDGTVDEVNLSATSYGDYFGNDTIQKGHTYTFQYTPKKKGTYIIEINEDEGYAAINTPIYIGNKIPLIPDFLDLEGEFTLSKSPINIETSRDEILSQLRENRLDYLRIQELSDRHLSIDGIMRAL